MESPRRISVVDEDANGMIYRRGCWRRTWRFYERRIIEESIEYWSRRNLG